MAKDLIGLKKVETTVHTVTQTGTTNTRTFAEYPIAVETKWVEIVRDFLNGLFSAGMKLKAARHTDQVTAMLVRGDWPCEGPVTTPDPQQKCHQAEVCLPYNPDLIYRRIVETDLSNANEAKAVTITFSPEQDHFSTINLELLGDEIKACTLRGEISLRRLVVQAMHMYEKNPDKKRISEASEQIPLETILKLLWLYANQQDEKVENTISIKRSHQLQGESYKVLLQKYEYAASINENRTIPGTEITVPHQVSVSIPGYRLQIIIDENLEDVFVPADFLFNPSAEIRCSNQKIIPLITEIVSKLVS